MAINTKTRGVALPDSYWDQLGEIANKSGQSVNKLIRVAIEQTHEVSVKQAVEQHRTDRSVGATTMTHGATRNSDGTFAVTNDPQNRTFPTLLDAMRAAGEMNRKPVAVATEPRYWKQDGTPVFKRRERVKEEW